MAYDEGLAERIRDIVLDQNNITEKKMFGGLAFLQEGHMFVGINDNRLMARVGPKNYQDALAKPHVHEMDFTGKSFKGYVYVESEGIESDEDLQYWIELASSFTQSLPPKKK